MRRPALAVLLALALALTLATSCSSGDTPTLAGARIDTNIRLSVGESRYLGLTKLEADGGAVVLDSMRVEGPEEVAASVLLLDLRRTPPVVASAVIDRSAAVDLKGTEFKPGEPSRYAPTLAVRPRARGVHRLTAIEAVYRVEGKRKTVRLPINVTITAD